MSQLRRDVAKETVRRDIPYLPNLAAHVQTRPTYMKGTVVYLGSSLAYAAVKELGYYITLFVYALCFGLVRVHKRSIQLH